MHVSAFLVTLQRYAQAKSSTETPSKIIASADSINETVASSYCCSGAAN